MNLSNSWVGTMAPGSLATPEGLDLAGTQAFLKQNASATFLRNS
jgi:hypothetical protein